MPMLRRSSRRSFSESCVSSFPFTVTVPAVGFSSRLIHRTRVLLPAPERPMTPKISPSYMVKSTSFRAVTAVSPVPKVLVMPFNSMIGFAMPLSSFPSSVSAAVPTKKPLTNYSVRGDNIPRYHLDFAPASRQDAS